MPDQKRLDDVERFLVVVKRWFIVITVLFFLILLGFSWTVHDIRAVSKKTAILSVENTNRINEIQDSRVSSCKTTYRGIRKVFSPFFPPSPRTEQQQHDVNQFNRIIHDLVDGCGKQTKPHKDRKKNE